MTLYAQPQSLPDLLVRGRTTRVECPLYATTDYATLTAPTAAGSTLTIYKPGTETAYLAASAITVSSSTAVYDVAVASTDDLGDRYLEKWVLVVGTETQEFWRECAVVRSPLRPMITLDDLEIFHEGLTAFIKRADETTAQAQARLQNSVEAGWRMVWHQIRQQGRWPWLVMSPSSFYLPLVYATLARFFRAAYSREGGTLYRENADNYAAEYDKAMSNVVYSYDADDDGILDGSEGETDVSAMLPGIAKYSRRWR